jgi:hypothetical protein
MSFVLYAIVAMLFLIYKFVTRNDDYFVKKGIPFSKPTFFVGSRMDLILRNKSIIQVICDWYNEFRDEK